MLNIQGVSAGYGKKEVLSHIDLSVEKGKITTLIGANGCGKSTLLKTIVGLVPMTTGDILSDGVFLRTLSPADRAKRIAYLPQGKNIPDISVGRMVLHGRFPHLSYPRKYRKSDLAIAQAAMQRMGIDSLSEMPMSSLSGGMRQKVYIAAALAQDTPIILMDEPTTYLDIGEQLRFMKMVRSLSDAGKTIVLVLHDIVSALRVSDHIAVLHEGTIAAYGSPADILSTDILHQIYGISVRSGDTASGLQYYYELD